LIPSQPERLGRTTWCSGPLRVDASSLIVACIVKRAYPLLKGCGWRKLRRHCTKSALRPVASRRAGTASRHRCGLVDSNVCRVRCRCDARAASEQKQGRRVGYASVVAVAISTSSVSTCNRGRLGLGWNRRTDILAWIRWQGPTAGMLFVDKPPKDSDP